MEFMVGQIRTAVRIYRYLRLPPKLWEWGVR